MQAAGRRPGIRASTRRRLAASCSRRSNSSDETSTRCDPPRGPQRSGPRPRGRRHRVRAGVRARAALERTLGERHRLEVGESFDLDEQKWTVREISLDEDSVTFECGQELRKVKRGKTLDQPHATETLASKAPADGDSN